MRFGQSFERISWTHSFIHVRSSVTLITIRTAWLLLQSSLKSFLMELLLPNFLCREKYFLSFVIKVWNEAKRSKNFIDSWHNVFVLWFKSWTMIGRRKIRKICEKCGDVSEFLKIQERPPVAWEDIEHKKLEPSENFVLSFSFSKFPFLLESNLGNCLYSWYNEMRLGLKTFCQLIKT